MPLNSLTSAFPVTTALDSRRTIRLPEGFSDYCTDVTLLFIMDNVNLPVYPAKEESFFQKRVDLMSIGD